MPGKTKNKRANRRNKKTRSQRGGDIWNTLSFGYAGTPEDPTTTTSSSSWSDWFGLKSNPNDKSWWDKLTSPNTNTNTNTNTYDSSSLANPMQQPYAPAPTAPTAPTAPYESSLSNTDYQGGKRSKSKSKCHRKHKHSKYCKK